MKYVEYAIITICLFISIFLVIKTYYGEKIIKNTASPSKYIARVGIFGAISAILYVVPFLNLSIPGFPPFLSIHFDEIPAFIASFAYGSWYGVGVIFVKTIIKLPFTSTMCVGEISDFIYSIAFIIPASLIYHKKRTFKFAIVGLLVGMICQLIVSLITNIYVMIPFYTFFMGFSEEALLSIMQLGNPNISNIGWGYGLYAVLPFNIIKDTLVIIITIVIYKSLRRFISRLQTAN